MPHTTLCTFCSVLIRFWFVLPRKQAFATDRVALCNQARVPLTIIQANAQRSTICRKMPECEICAEESVDQESWFDIQPCGHGMPAVCRAASEEWAGALRVPLLQESDHQLRGRDCKDFTPMGHRANAAVNNSCTLAHSKNTRCCAPVNSHKEPA